MSFIRGTVGTTIQPRQLRTSQQRVWVAQPPMPQLKAKPAACSTTCQIHSVAYVVHPQTPTHTFKYLLAVFHLYRAARVRGVGYLH